MIFFRVRLRLSVKRRLRNSLQGLFLIFAFFALIDGVIANSHEIFPDTIYINGQIYTVDDERLKSA